MPTTCRHPLPHSGTSQTTRLLSALSPTSVKLDAHEVEDLMVYAQALSQQVCYWNYNAQNADHLDGNWSAFWASDPLFLLAAIAATDTQAIDKQYRQTEGEVLKLLAFVPDAACDTDPRPAAIRQLVDSIYQLAAQMAFWGQQEPAHPALLGELGMMVTQQLGPALRTLVAYDLGTPGELNDYRTFLCDRNDHPFAKNWNLDYLQFTQIGPIATTDADQVIDGDVVLPLRDLFKTFLRVLVRLRARAKHHFAAVKNGPREHQPHIALFLAFLDLFNTLQVQLNGLTAQHLDYYYGQVLQIGKRESVSDQVHLVFQLAVGAVRERLEAGTLFRAGKDRQYALERDLTLNQGKVAEIHTLYLEGNEALIGIENNTFISSAHFYSALDSDKKNAVPDKIEAVTPFHSLGHGGNPLASIGFAIASGQFETSAAERVFTITLAHNSAAFPTGDNINWDAYLGVELSTEKEALPLSFTKGEVSIESIANELKLVITLSKQHPAITTNSSMCCGKKMNLPVLRCFLKPAAFTALLNISATQHTFYQWIETVKIQKVTISADVTGVTDFRLEEGNTGLALPSTQNVWVNRYLGTGLRLYSKELFGKNASFSLASNLKATRVIDNGTATTEAVDIGEYVVIASIRDYLSILAVNIGTFQIYNAPPQPAPYWGPLTGNWGNYSGAVPLQNFAIPTAAPRALPTVRSRGGDTVFNPPVTPTIVPRGDENKSVWFDFINPGSTTASESTIAIDIQRFIDLSLDYSSTQVIFQATSDERQDDNLDHFYYLGPIDSCWELEDWHKLDENNQKQPFPLFPNSDKYPHFRRPAPVGRSPLWANGNLFIGLDKLEPGQMASLLFQVLEGSEGNYCKTPEVEWAYLDRTNCWQRFPPGAVTFDSTRGDENSRRSLVQSGIVELQIPADAYKDSCLIKPGFIWVRASAVERAGESVDALPKLAAIHAQAGRVKLHTTDPDPSHFDAALAAETIAQLQVRRATVRKTEQKYPGFGGRAPEPALDWYLRISERLRHKRRAITQWDYERLVLERFPDVRTAKCVNHSWLVAADAGPCANAGAIATDQCANGHVSIVVLPYLKDYSVQNPFTPQPSAGLLEQVAGYLRPAANMFVADLWTTNTPYLHVLRPEYQQVAVSVKVKFKPELSDTEIWTFQLDTDIARFISPWAFDEKIAPDFSRSIRRTDLLFFLENLDYVDYVTDLYIGKVADTIVFKNTEIPFTTILPEHEGALLTTFIRPVGNNMDTDLLGALPAKTLFNTNHHITVIA